MSHARTCACQIAMSHARTCAYRLVESENSASYIYVLPDCEEPFSFTAYNTCSGSNHNVLHSPSQGDSVNIHL